MPKSDLTQAGFPNNDGVKSEFPTLYTEEEMLTGMNQNNSLTAETRRLKAKLTKSKSAVETLT